MTGALTAFWIVRTPRERVLLGGLALLLAGYLGVAAVWQPLQRNRMTTASDITRYAGATTALSTIASGTAPIPAFTSDTPLPSIITDTAAAYQLAIRRLQPTEGAADITLEDAAFDVVLLWIDTLERDHGLRVITLTMTRRPEPGLVATTLTIGR